MSRHNKRTGDADPPQRRLLIAVPSTAVAFALVCFAAVTTFEIVPLETVSETSSNASIGDLNGDGHPDIVLVKGRHWQLTSKVLLAADSGACE